MRKNFYIINNKDINIKSVQFKRIIENLNIVNDHLKFAFYLLFYLKNNNKLLKNKWILFDSIIELFNKVKSVVLIC